MLHDFLEPINNSDSHVKGVSIRNPYTKIVEFYEISRPYIITLEYFNLTDNDVRLAQIGPQYHAEYKYTATDSDPLQNRNLHRHDFFEIMYVLKGSTVHRIEEQQYVCHAGQCCLLNHNVRHVEVPTEDTELCFLMLSDPFLLTLIQNDIIFDKEGHPCQTQNPLYRFFLDCRKNTDSRKKYYWDFYPVIPAGLIVPQLEHLFAGMILESKEMSAGSYLAVQSMIARLFQTMLDPALYHNRKIALEGNKNEYLFSQIQMILEERNGRISREELASVLNYDAHYLNRIVNQSIGMSLLEYGRFFLLREAARLLIQTDDNISSVMDQLGVSNRSFFYRIFKEQYGLTPNEYRKQIRKEQRK